MTRMSMVAVVLLTACGAPLPDDLDVAESTQPIWGGHTYSNCSHAEVLKLHDAMGVLLAITSSGFAAFKSCLASADLVENQCTTGQAIAELLRRDDTTRIKCQDLPGANGEATVSIRGEELKIDHDLLRNHTARVVAAVISHELMHNRGFRHDRNDFRTTYYHNTVPNQVEACVLNGRPNPWPGGGAGPASQLECDVCGDTHRSCCERNSGGHCLRCITAGRRCNGCRTNEFCCETRPNGMCMRCYPASGACS
jgi:hypothetical protein